jgi:sugar phosphate isomerase/epimerase
MLISSGCFDTLMEIGSSSLTTRLYGQIIDSRSEISPGKQAPEIRVQTTLRTIRRVSEIGLGLIDLPIVSDAHLQLLAEGGVEAIKKRCVDLGIKVDRISCAFVSEWPFGNAATDHAEKQWNRIGKIANVLDASIVELTSPSIVSASTVIGLDAKVTGVADSVNPYYLEEPWSKIWMSYVRAIRSYCGIARKFGLDLALEPRPKELLSCTDSLLRLFEAADDENLGGLVDVSHLYMAQEVPEVGIRKLNDRVLGVHLSDNDGITDWHWAPGNGKINWPPIFASLTAVGYKGELSLDVSGIDIEDELIEGKTYVENILAAVPVSSRKRRM